MFRDPEVNSSFGLDGKKYQFTEAPNAPGIIYAEIGRKAKVYRVLSEGKAYALKAFKAKYRTVQLLKNNKQIVKYADVPGLSVARRLVITPEAYPDLIKQYEEFAYAILMPWVDGRSWFNYVTGKLAIEREESLRLARALINSVAELEARNLAHCDLSSGNFIFSSDFAHVELIDIEDMFGPALQEPKPRPNGTGGYAPGWLKASGVWEAGADRFSTGILVSEILGWQFGDIREISSGDAYFAEGEFGNRSKRFRLLSERLEQIHPQLSKLFKTVWYAESLEECPRIADWKHTLDAIRQPILLVSPDTLKFSTLDLSVKSPVQPQASITVKNGGGSLLKGRITPNVPWIHISPMDFSCPEGMGSEHRVTLTLDAPRRRGQQHYSVPNLISIKSPQQTKNLPGQYSVAFPEIRTPAWLYALIGTVTLGALLLCIGAGTGWAVLNSPQPPTHTATEFYVSSVRITDTPISVIAPNTVTPSDTPRPTLSPTVTPIPVKYAYIAVSQANLYQGPGMGYYLATNHTYETGDKFTVLERNPNGYWLLCQSSDGKKGWLFVDWVSIDFDPLVIPTASYIPPVPPTETRKPKNSH